MLLYDSVNTCQCSCRAAIRFGTNWTGTTIFVRTGARTTCSCSASLISLSESGITSQNVSVKSNGVWAIEQKFEYVRGAVLLSSGTIVKLICLGWSGMPKSNPPPGGSVLPHHADDDALDLNLVGLDEQRLHGGVGRLQTNHPARVAIELLERHVRSAQQCDHHFARFGRLAIFDDYEVAVANLLVDHGVATHAEHVRIAFADEILRDSDRLARRDGFDGDAGCHVAEQRQLHRASAGPRRHHLDRPAPIPGALDEPLFLLVGQMFVHRGERREAEAPTDFLQARCVPVLLDELVEVVENLALPLGKWKHRG